MLQKRDAISQIFLILTFVLIKLFWLGVSIHIKTDRLDRGPHAIAAISKGCTSAADFPSFTYRLCNVQSPAQCYNHFCKGEGESSSGVSASVQQVPSKTNGKAHAAVITAACLQAQADITASFCTCCLFSRSYSPT